MKKHTILLFILSSFLSSYIYSQSRESKHDGDLIKSYSEKYIVESQGYAALFNGLEQAKTQYKKSAYLRKKGHKDYNSWGKEFFDIESEVNGTFDEGSLLYNGILYNKVFMRLDIFTDELMVRTPNNIHAIVLDPAFVEFAYFNGYKIIHIGADVNESVLRKGYYQQLYEGKSTVLKKETIVLNRSEMIFNSWKKNYFICIDGLYHRVKDKKHLLDILKSHKTELEEFIKDMKINTNDMEAALPLIVEQYDKLGTI